MIAERTHTSFGYIGAVRRDAAKDREAVEEQVQKACVSTQAYKLFTKGKNPVQVAITLNIREQEVDQYLKEYFKLQKMDNLHQMYQAITDDMESFVELFKRMKDANMNPEHVAKLFSVAKNGLDSLSLNLTQ